MIACTVVEVIALLGIGALLTVSLIGIAALLARPPKDFP